MSTANDEIVYGSEEEVVVESGEEDADTPDAVSDAPEPQLPKAPGKVNPTKEVKSMKMATPESAAKAPNSVIPPNKNPFTTIGSWTPELFNQVQIEVPLLNPKNETTNELTKANRPENRYWRGGIVFKHGNYTSDTLRVENVPIPHHTGKGYGNNFVYMCLPGFMGQAFAEAGKTRRPTVATEKSLVPDSQRWWKVANNVAERFGVINNATKKFHKKSLETIFDSTRAGITATVVLRFNFKASTEGLEPLKATTSGTISIELERGYINEVDVAVQAPTRVETQKNRPEPKAISKDVASDSLLKRLSEIGL